MLAKIAPRFVISGVIQNAYYANYMAVQLTKQIIGDRGLPFSLEDPKHYFECNFFGFLTTQTRPSEFTSQYEAEQYDQAVKKFAVYNEVKHIFDHLNEFTIEVKELFRVVEANNTSSNFFSRSNSSDQTWEEDVNDCLARYHTFLQKLEPYPEWREKIIEEVGKWFHLIHNNLGEGQIKRNIFAQLNRQDYFV